MLRFQINVKDKTISGNHKANKGSIVAGLVAVVVVLLLIWRLTSGENEEETVYVSPEVTKACSSVVAKARSDGRVDFSTSEHVIMTECLIERDPAYAAAYQRDLCRRAKSSGVRPETFKQPALRRCFGLE